MEEKIEEKNENKNKKGKTSKVVKKKRKRIILFSISSFLIIIIVAACVLFFGGGEIPTNAYNLGATTTVKELPVSSDPSKESDLDNLAYLAYKLQHSEFYSQTTGTAKASISGIPYTQYVNDYRIVTKDGMLQQTISYSSMKSFALQKYYFDDKIIERAGTAINGGTDANWEDTALRAITYAYSNEIYGWTPDQISAYILCSDLDLSTILSTERLDNDSNGNYVIKYVLNPETAPYYYQRQVKTYADASTYPGYLSVELTYTFDSNWNIISCHSSETYKIGMFGMVLQITTDLLETFTYGENLTISEASFYEQYKDLEPIGEADPTTDEEIDPNQLLINAFDSLLSGNTETFEVDLNINDIEYMILAEANISTMTFNININDKLYIIYDGDNNLIYLSYDNINLMFDLSDTEKLESFITFINEYFMVDSSSSISIDTSTLLSSFNKANIITDDNGVVSLDVVFDISSISIPVTFRFTKDSDKYNLVDIKTNINLSSLAINAVVTPTTKNVNMVKVEEYEFINDALFVLNGIEDIIKSEQANLDINFSYEDISINGKAIYIYDDNLLHFTGTVIYDDVNISIDLIYYNNYIYIQSNDLKFKFDLDTFINKIDEVFALDEFDINSLFSMLPSDSLDIEISSLDISNNNINILLNDEYDITLESNNGNLIFKLNDYLTLDIYGSNKDIVEIEEDYYDITSFSDLISFYVDNLGSEIYKISLDTNILINEESLPLCGALYFDNNFENIKFDGSINGETLSILYTNEFLYLTIFNNSFKIRIDELNSFISKFSNTNISIDVTSISNLLNDISVDDFIFSYENDNINLSFNSIEIADILSLSEMNIVISKCDTDITLIPSDIEYQDLNNILDLVSDIYDIVDTKKIELNLDTSITYNEYELAVRGNVSLDYTTDLLAKADLTLTYDDNDIDLLVYYDSKYVYLICNNINVKVTIEELLSLIGSVEDNSSDFTISKYLPKVLDILNTLTLTSSENKLDITLSLASIISELDNISLDITSSTGSINLNIGSINYSDIKIENTNIILTESNESIEIPTDTSNYITYDDINKVIDLVNDVTTLLDNKIALKIETSLSVSDLDISATIDAIFDYNSLSASGTIKLEVFSTIHNLAFTYHHDTKMIYLNYGNLGIMLSTDDIPTLINKINEIYTITDDSSSDSSLSITISQIVSILDKLFVSFDNDVISLTLNLSSLVEGLSEFNISITNNDSILVDITNIEYDSITISTLNIDLSKSCDSIQIPTDTIDYLTIDDLTTIIDYVSDVIDIVKKDNIYLSFNTDIYNNGEVRFKASATIMVNLSSDGELNFDIKLDIISQNDTDSSYAIDFTVYDDYCYIGFKLAERSNEEYGFMYLKTTISDGLSILGTITKFLGVDIPMLNQFINSGFENVDLDDLGSLYQNNLNDLKSIVFSDYLLGIYINVDSLDITISGDKLFNSTDNLIVSFSKDSSDTVNSLTVSNIYSSNTSDTVEKFDIELKLLTEEVSVTKPTGDYIDISTINNLLGDTLNTATLDDFDITGTFAVTATIASIDIDMDISFHIKVTLDEDKVPTIYIYFEDIPVITGVNNDVPYEFGDTVSGIYPGLNRNLSIYIKDGYTYFYRSETVPVFGSSSGRTYEKKLKITTSTFTSNLLEYLLGYGMGFSDTIMESLTSAFDSSNENTIDMANVIVAYSKNEDGTYIITLNLAELTGNSDLGNVAVTIGSTTVDDKSYVYSLTFNLDISLSGIAMNLNTSDTKLNNITESIDMSNLESFISSYLYSVGEKWAASNSSWAVVDEGTKYTLTLYVDGEVSETQSLACGDSIDYSNFEKVKLDNDIYYVFDGWYSDSDYKNEAIISTMTDGDLSLYARWVEATLSYKIDSNESVTITSDITKITFDSEVLLYSEAVISGSISYGYLFTYITIDTLTSSFYEYAIFNDETNMLEFVFITTSSYSNDSIHYIRYTLDSDFTSGYTICGIYTTTSIKVSDLPNYSTTNFEVNAWFSDSSYTNLLSLSDSLDNIDIIYPYYSSKASFFTYSSTATEPTIIGGVSGSDLSTLIVPIYSSTGKVITTINCSESNADVSGFSDITINTIVISNYITTIGSNAFKGLKSIQTVYFGNSVTSLYYDAFYIENKDSSMSTRSYYYLSSMTSLKTQIEALYAYKQTYLFKDDEYKTYGDTYSSTLKPQETLDIVSIIATLV